MYLYKDLSSNLQVHSKPNFTFALQFPSAPNFTLAGSTLAEFHRVSLPGSSTLLGVPPPWEFHSRVPLWLNSTRFRSAWGFHPAGCSTRWDFHSSRNSTAWEFHSPQSFTLRGSSTLLGVPPPESSTPLGIQPR